MGELDYSRDTDGASPKDYTITAFKSHPDYRPEISYNDIALIQLSEKVIFTPEVRPACIPKSPEVDPRMIASGWGLTSFAGSKSPHLLKVVLEKFTRNECTETYKFGSSSFPTGLQNSQFCAGDKVKAKDTCDGDSGGPIQGYHKELTCMYTLFGITSLGQGCGTVGVPGLYTHTYSYIDWIEVNVW